MKNYYLILKSVFILSLISLGSSSCKKEIQVSQNSCRSSILGLWIGHYTVESEAGHGEQYFSYILKPDGTLINDTEGDKIQHLSLGTWSLKGNNLNCEHTCIYGLSKHLNITETSTAVWDSTNNKITGTWKHLPPLSGYGKFVLTKVQ